MSAPRENDRASHRPVATVEIFVDAHLGIHARIDDTTLAPIRPPGQPGMGTISQTPSQILADLVKSIDALASGFGEVSKLPRYDEATRNIGDRLGGILFGSTDPGRGGWHNELSLALGALYDEAHATGGFVSLSLAAEDPQWDALPWELTRWRRGRTGHCLGIAHHFAMSRRLYHTNYPAPSPRPPSNGQGLILRHVSSLLSTDNPHAYAAENLEHQRTEDLLGELREKSHGILARTDVLRSGLARAWSGKPMDIFQFFGHGTPDGYLQWIVEKHGRGNGLQVGPAQLVRILNAFPRLFVLVACHSHSFAVQLLHQTASERSEAALAVHGPWRVLPEHHQYLIRVLYTQLFEHGRLDRAVQATRRYLYDRELGRSLTPDARLPENWFRPVLVIRDRAALDAFHENARQTRTHGTTRGIEKHNDKQRAILEALHDHHQIQFPTSWDEFQSKGDTLRQHLQGLDWTPFPELSKQRDLLVSDLEAVAGAGASSESLQDSDWQTWRERWERLEWTAATAAVELGLSNQDIEQVIEGIPASP